MSAATQRRTVFSRIILSASKQSPEQTFEQEFITILERHKITYDPRYLFEQEVGLCSLMAKQNLTAADGHQVAVKQIKFGLH